MPNPSPVNRKIAELLKREKLLTAAQVDEALRFAEEENARVEEAVLELGFATEADLLKVLAGHYKTRFVSTEKLSKAAIDKPTLAMIPRQVAEALAIFPVMFDGNTSTLSVVTCDPDDLQTLRDVQSVSGAKKVNAFVARPRAVKAAIARAHAGDLQAFARLEMMNQAQMHGFLEVRGRTEPPVASKEPVRKPSEVPRANAAAKNAPPPAQLEPPSAVPPPPRRETPGPLRRPTLGSLIPPGLAAPEKVAGYSADEVLELLNVLISLLENTRVDLRGHSAHVSRLTRRVVERMNLPVKAVVDFSAAAYLHDLGKMGNFHLTALNCAEYDGHKVAAQKAFRTPARLLEAVRISPDTTKAIVHMYERYDGKGFPDGLAAKDIPLGARILGVVDTYADLTQNPRNPYRKTLSPGEACEVLMKFKRTVFDPDVVDLFHNVMMGEDLKARLLADRYVALIVDPDPEETTVLELRMIEQGFEVKIARTVEQAQKLLGEGNIDIVVSEVDLPPGDGLTLLAESRRQSWGKELPWVVHTRRQGRVEAQRAFELGVIDFVSKPTATDVLVAKLKASLDNVRRTTKAGKVGGVSGSLREMGLPDMVQVLFHGRKTGNLKIRNGNDAGEIHFDAGAVVNAKWGAIKGVDAFYQMLKLTDGEFQLDPSFKPQERVINESAEALLLEGMRRLDEGLTA
jgi:response regulator RpfG family c-di-GMP phosphodiesterase